MCGLLSRNTIIGFALFLSVPLFGLGCGDFERGFGTDGWEKSGSIFNVEYIDPTYFQESVRQVDVWRSGCEDPGDDPDPEPYTDHFADVTFTNRPLNNSLEQTASTIYLTEYSVWYEPLTLGSPSLSSNIVTTVKDYSGIEPCEPSSQCSGETLSGIEFVPVRLKKVISDYLFGEDGFGGSCASGGPCQLEYNIYYIFYGQNDYGYGVSADGATNFLATDYDNCGGG